ncbi:MAG: hypothetical protein AAF355_11370 [Myxococcota bacterium]
MVPVRQVIRMAQPVAERPQVPEGGVRMREQLWSLLYMHVEGAFLLRTQEELEQADLPRAGLLSST